MGELSQNTNLASEYYVLSMLYRIGADAHLTLGNKKSIDIVVTKGNSILSIDVKGLLGTTNFPIDNWKKMHKTHFLIFVSFKNEMNNPSALPEVYIVPSSELEKKRKLLIYSNPKGNRTVVPLGRLRKVGEKYRDKWNYFI